MLSLCFILYTSILSTIRSASRRCGCWGAKLFIAMFCSRSIDFVCVQRHCKYFLQYSLYRTKACEGIRVTRLITVSSIQESTSAFFSVQ